MINLDHFLYKMTPHAAYILGFLWADGYIAKGSRYFIRLEICKKDADELTAIFESTGKWTRSYRKRPNRKEQCTIEISSKPLHSFLKSIGYSEKATGDASRAINAVPRQLHKYWARGFFDGDGSVYFNKKNYIRHAFVGGTFSQDWAGISGLFINEARVPFRIYRRSYINKTGKINHHSVLRVSDRYSILKLSKFLYRGEQFGLSRKKEKFNLCVS